MGNVVRTVSLSVSETSVGRRLEVVEMGDKSTKRVVALVVSLGGKTVTEGSVLIRVGPSVELIGWTMTDRKSVV